MELHSTADISCDVGFIKKMGMSNCDTDLFLRRELWSTSDFVSALLDVRVAVPLLLRLRIVVSRLFVCADNLADRETTPIIASTLTMTKRLCWLICGYVCCKFCVLGV